MLHRAANGLLRLRDDLLDALYPPGCRLCGAFAADGWSCGLHRLAPGPSGPRCGRCAARLPDCMPPEATCAACTVAPPAFGRAVVLADYRSAAREWLLALKYERRAHLAGALGAALARRLREAARPAREALLAPVPLHPIRRLERGYDQAELLARAAGRAADLSVERLLARARATPVQGAPGSPSRAANVRGAFRPAEDAEAKVAGREVWIVDDVLTSGATASECARVLRRAGARRVDVLAVARGVVRSQDRIQRLSAPLRRG